MPTLHPARRTLAGLIAALSTLLAHAADPAPSPSEVVTLSPFTVADTDDKA